MKSRWIAEAEKHIGTREIKGAMHNTTILYWWAKINAPFRDDETPWCAAFVGGVLETSGIKSTRSAAARSYLKWGVELKNPCLGCVVVLWRGNPKSPFGHVGFVVGVTPKGELVVLGGNQGDCVSLRVFPRSRVLSYRYPIGEPTSAELPIIKNIHLSTTEA